jgi:hypothetical protein
MEAAKRSYARALKGSKKTNAERAKHRARPTSALSRYTKRNPNTKKPVFSIPPPLIKGYFIKPNTGPSLERAYPKTHIPKKAPVRNTTVAKERAQRVANQQTRRLSHRKSSGVPSRAEAHRRASISEQRETKLKKRVSESITRLHKGIAAKKWVAHMSVVPEEVHSASHINDLFEKS